MHRMLLWLLIAAVGSISWIEPPQQQYLFWKDGTAEFITYSDWQIITPKHWHNRAECDRVSHFDALCRIAADWTRLYDLDDFAALSRNWNYKAPAVEPNEPAVTEPNEPIEQPVIIPLVYVTPFGKKYHLPTCYYAAGSGIAIPITEAWTAGLGPCKVCKPDEYFLQENEL